MISDFLYTFYLENDLTHFIFYIYNKKLAHAFIIHFERNQLRARLCHRSIYFEKLRRAPKHRKNLCVQKFLQTFLRAILLTIGIRNIVGLLFILSLRLTSPALHQCEQSAATIAAL